MGINRVEVYLDQEDGGTAVGVRLLDRGATLEELLQAWQPLCDNVGLFKQFAEGNHSSCRACRVNCCLTAYVIPDLVAFKRMAALSSSSYEEFIRTCCDADKVNLGLLRLQPNPCVFLQEKMCGIYPSRALICRFYICSRLLGKTEEFVYRITWTGIAATQVFAEKKGLLPPPPSGGFTSLDRLFLEMIDRHRQGPLVEYFLAARDYRDIPLAPFWDD